MPEIKNTFTQGKMNKDLDERIVPNGQYRDAMNIQVTTSEGSDVGTVQNILGNERIGSIVGSDWECVGSIADEKNDVLYSFIVHNDDGKDDKSAIMEYAKDPFDGTMSATPVLVDLNNDVLNFSQGDIITGINVIDDLLLWTDGTSEPKKINIQRCKQGTDSLAYPTKLIVDGEEVFDKEINVVVSVASIPVPPNTAAATNIIEFSDTSGLTVGDQLISLQTTSGSVWNFITSPSAGPSLRYIAAINGNIVTLSDDIFTGGTANWIIGGQAVFHHYVNVTEEHITVIKKKPLRPLSVKINPADPSDKKPLFDKIFPRFSYRYKYEDGEYSAFAPFTDIVFNSEYPRDNDGIVYDENTAYDVKEPYNAGMRNMIQSIELTDFVTPDTPEDVVQIDLLYKQENSTIVYIVEVIKNTDAEWFSNGSNIASSYRGKFEVKSENIYTAVPSNQILRPWDNVPKTALAQEITGNRLVYGNYTQSYDLGTIPKVTSDYKVRFEGGRHEFPITYGPEILINGNFDLGSIGWGLHPNSGIALNSAFGISFTGVSGAYKLNQGSGSSSLNPAIAALIEGEKYSISFDVTDYTSGYLHGRLSNSSVSTVFPLDYNSNNPPVANEGINHVGNYEYIITLGEHSLTPQHFGRFYLESHDFVGSVDNISVKHVEVNEEAKTFERGGFPSVKSQRNYQLGVVYGDKYGRETPVFTSPESSVVIPWEDIGSITTSGADYPLASFSLQLKASLDSFHPSWADYYKFFVKETSGEYYNLVMDAIYNPTKEDLAEDDHIWMSFASSDRNKISEDDYIIFKKKVDESKQITNENKFRVLDVKNEAPDAIKYKYISLGEIPNDFSDNTGILNVTPGTAQSGLFPNTSLRPFNDNGKNILHVNKAAWHYLGGARLVDGDNAVDGEQKAIENLYFSFTKAVTDGDNQSSEKKYRVASVEVAVSSGSEYYAVKLSETITEKDDTLIRGDAVDPNIHSDIVIKFEQKLIKDSEAFSGRFFVKILSSTLIKTELETDALNLLEVLSNYKITEIGKAFWHSDNNVSSGYDITSGLVNKNGHEQTYTNDPNSLHLEGDLTKTAAAWDTILTKMKETPSRWFIDRMHMVAEQTGVYARHATYGWLGGNANVDIGDVYNSGGGSYGDNDPGAGWSGYYIGNNPGHMRWPYPNDIKPQNPTHNTDGDNLINGLEGVVTTSNMHISSSFNYGLRRWRSINWNKNNTSKSFTNDYGTSTGKYYLHISYLAPGSNLHTGNFLCDNDDLDTEFSGNQNKTDAIWNNLQGIFGGGVFTSGNNTHLPNGDTVAMEFQTVGAGGWRGYGQTAPNWVPWNFYVNKHNDQWKLPTADKDFKNQLKAGNKFRFIADTNKTIYTIKRSNYNNPKKIYNHTPWRKMWKVDSSGSLVGMGNSVEEATIAWANTVDSAGNDGDSNLVDDLKIKLQDFGNKNNRRLVYVLELDKDPTDSSQNGGYNPVSGGTDMDSITPDTIEFITTDFELNAGEISQNPAIWETEPKDNVDLDIYYEAGQAYPITLTEENRELFAPVGSVVSFPDDTRPLNGVDDSLNPQIITPPIYISSWDGLELVFSKGVNQYWDDNGIGESINYVGMKIRFTNQDGSYTTATITEATLDPDAHGFIKSVTITPTTETGLSWYNCFSFGNGIESNRIRDDFNGMIITNGTIASTTLDRLYKEESRGSGLIYSGIYNSTSGINNLNQFVMAEKITKDLNPTFGSIQKLFTRRISLIAFCEDRVVGITANKDALYNADGNPQIVASNAVLGDANPFVGEYGISKNPESFAKESYRAYFTDKQRGAVLRLSMDGLTPISQAGMSNWFKDEFKKSQYNIIGSYDNYKNDYNLTLDGGSGEPVVASTTTISTPPRRTSTPVAIASGDSYTLTFSEDVKGWVSFKSFTQESGVSMSGDYYTFKGGRCWRHHNNSPRNTFYSNQITGETETGGGTTPSSIKFLLNESPLVIKNYNTLNYDGDENWVCDSITTDQQSGTVNEFIEKEGKWFNYIKGDVKAPLDTKSFNFQGIGMASNIQYNIQ